MLNELKKTQSLRKIPLQHQARDIRYWVLGSVLVLGILGFWLFRRPLFGLSGFVLGPAFFRFWTNCLTRSRSKQFDEEILFVLMALSGMTRSGLSLPAALGLVTESEQFKIAPVISRYLTRFKSGRSFQEVLDSFQERSGLKHAGPALVLLGIAQSQGIGISKLLEEMTETLRETLETDRRIGGLRRSVLFQGCFATLMPWGILALLYFVDPVLMAPFFSSRKLFYLGSSCLAFQALGGYFLWKVSRFR